MTALVRTRRAARRIVARGVEARSRAAAPRISEERWVGRLAVLAAALRGGPSSTAGGEQRSVPESEVLQLLDGADDATTWLALAVLAARLPTVEEVTDARRASQLEGPAAILAAARSVSTHASAEREVEVRTDATLVDMGDLVLFPLGTGIQRVARSVISAWRESQSFVAVAWTPEMDGLYAIDDAARDAALTGTATTVAIADPHHATSAPTTVLVPWGGRYVLPELAIQPRRCASLQALARYSPARCGVIGFDCVPITSAETSATGFPAVFALNLAAVAEFDVVATISEAAAAEYEGWRRMLSGAGLDGPEVREVQLPADAPHPSEQDLRDARDRFVVADMPFILCVGSHEPRKNHLAVLHAAELLWRRGHRFSLTFVGGASWNSEHFADRLAELESAGRPVESVSRLSDRMLWAAYRIARCTVFPSVNEGFGLPVAESLAAGTPVITSNFGSMAEIARGGGALTVDPRDDHGLSDAMERLIVDDELHRDLTDQARARPVSSWSDYAARVWNVFHDTTVGAESTARHE